MLAVPELLPGHEDEDRYGPVYGHIYGPIYRPVHGPIYGPVSDSKCVPRMRIDTVAFHRSCIASLRTPNYLLM